MRHDLRTQWAEILSIKKITFLKKILNVNLS